MVKLQKPQSTVQAIYDNYEGRQGDSRRPHLGGSLIGDGCERKLWYTFRWARKIKHDGRLLKLFGRGHSEEFIFVRELRGVGVEVLEIDPATGRQWTINDVRGHFGGSFDAVAKGLKEAPETWHLVEMKTHNDKSFQDMLKKGVEKSKYQHFCQMQVYMYLGGLERAYYLAVNKNNDELYSERIKLDVAIAKRLVAKAERIIDAPEPPLPAYSADWYLCKWCDFNEQCHKGAFSERNCRTCMHSTPVDDGKWTCNVGDPFKISVKTQREGCSSHRFIPALVPHQQIDVVDNNIIYEGYKDDGK